MVPVEEVEGVPDELFFLGGGHAEVSMGGETLASIRWRPLMPCFSVAGWVVAIVEMPVGGGWDIPGRTLPKVRLVDPKNGSGGLCRSSSWPKPSVVAKGTG